MIRTRVLAAAMAAMLASAAPAAPHQAVPIDRFLDSIGVVSSFAGRGQPLDRTIEMIRYGGFRWVRGGIEGLKEGGPQDVGSFVELHRATGAKISWGLVSGGSDVGKLVATGRVLAKAGALLAFEGNNEPNNWTVTLDGVEGGGKTRSWKPVAEIQARLYAAVKADPVVRGYPVWSITEGGAETDDVGLQYLTIPPSAGAVMPEGTRYADVANVHNYLVISKDRPPEDNLAWNAADPTSAVRADGLYHEYGVTWNRHFKGYDQAALDTLPRVTTETGLGLQDLTDEHAQGTLLLNVYLAQFARGYSHTSIYILRDRTDEGGNQTYGFFRPDYTPRKAATYIHDLTTILSHGPGRSGAVSLDYDIPNRSATVHDLLFKRPDGAPVLIVWGERVKGEDRIVVKLGDRRTAIVYDPTIGTDPVRTEKNVDHLDLTLSDHPLVIEMLPVVDE